MQGTRLGIKTIYTIFKLDNLNLKNIKRFSVDGRKLVELKHDNYLLITTSEFPLPSICRSDQVEDWFEGLAECLNWNLRKKQLPFNPASATSPKEDDDLETVIVTKTMVRQRSREHESFKSSKQNSHEKSVHF